MSLTKRQLPIASPCQEFVGRRATATEPAFCTRCEKSVHDLSRLTEDEVITLLARHRGQRVCVSYRARTDGTIATKPRPSRLAPAALAVSLAGCAGHLVEAERSTSRECVDAAGYGIDCPPTPRLADAVIPDDVAPQVIVAPPSAKDPVIAPPEDVQVAGGVMVPDEPSLPSREALEAAIDGEIMVPDVDPDPRPELGEQPERMAGEMTIDPSLERRIRKEAKRLERREARRTKNENKRLAQH